MRDLKPLPYEPLRAYDWLFSILRGPRPGVHIIRPDYLGFAYLSSPKPETMRRLFPRQILLRPNGNLYLGRASQLIANFSAQVILDELKAGAAHVKGDFNYFAYVLDRENLVLLSRAKTEDEARDMMAHLPTETILVHFGTRLL